MSHGHRYHAARDMGTADQLTVLYPYIIPSSAGCRSAVHGRSAKQGHHQVSEGRGTAVVIDAICAASRRLGRASSNRAGRLWQEKRKELYVQQVGIYMPVNHLICNYVAIMGGCDVI
jgi:hypothetical protein